MPNLNKIRGQKKHSTGPPSSSRSGMGRGQMGYGLSASRHHNSDPRMIQAPRRSGHHKNSNNSSNIKPMTTNSTYQQHYHGVPSRGTVISRDVSTWYLSSNWFDLNEKLSNESWKSIFLDYQRKLGNWRPCNAGEKVVKCSWAGVTWMDRIGSCVLTMMYRIRDVDDFFDTF